MAPIEATVLATLGPAGTYSEVATRKYAMAAGLPEAKIVFGPVEQCLAMAEEGVAAAAVLPAENLVDGLIGATFDALIEHDGAILAFDEVHLAITHVLAASGGRPDAAIARVFSHPSALNQCARNLAKAAPHAEVIPVGSTAEAAARIAQGGEPGWAAICSGEAASAYGLHVLYGDFGDYPGNQTRFLVCGCRESPPSGDDRSLVAVHYGLNRSGQLHRTAGAFAGHGVDLAAVHSRPSKARPREYVLLFELVGHHADPLVGRALGEIAIQVGETGGWWLVLGSYPRRGLD